MVEGRLGPPPADDHPARAVPEHVHVRAAQGGDHAAGHAALVHAQLRMDARHHHLEPGEEGLVLVEGAVLEDVHLDAGQDTKRSQLGVDLRDHFQLALEALRREAVGHGERG